MALPAKIASYHCWAASAYLERVSGEGVGGRPLSWGHPLSISPCEGERLFCSFPCHKSPCQGEGLVGARGRGRLSLPLAQVPSPGGGRLGWGTPSHPLPQGPPARGRGVCRPSPCEGEVRFLSLPLAQVPPPARGRGFFVPSPRGGRLGWGAAVCYTGAVFLMGREESDIIGGMDMRLGRLVIPAIAAIAVVLLGTLTGRLVLTGPILATEPTPIAIPLPEPPEKARPVERSPQATRSQAAAAPEQEPVHTWEDGDRTMRVVLQDDLVVQKSAANRPRTWWSRREPGTASSGSGPGTAPTLSRCSAPSRERG